MDPTDEMKKQVAGDSSVDISSVPDSNYVDQQMPLFTENDEACKAVSPEASVDDDDNNDCDDDGDGVDGEDIDNIEEEEMVEEEEEAEEEEENHDFPPEISTIFDVSSTNSVYSSVMSVAPGDDDASDLCSSIVASENADSAIDTLCNVISKSTKMLRKRSRQPPIMIGYKKRRKAQYSAAKKYDDEAIRVATSVAENDSEVMGSWDGSDKSESSLKSLEPSSSEENLFESSAASNQSSRKYSSVVNEVTGADKFCWICHKEGGSMLKCIACPRVFHSKCYFPAGFPEDPNYDPSNFHCPECSAVLKADNVNTRSPVLVTVNLEQLCTLLKHIITILKSQKDSHYFWGPVDTNEFPQYRQYVVYPMDISILEKNIKNKVYGCTEAFLADVRWIVHNSIVFNSKAAKITNVANNLLKICKREILEIETCAECYYNSLVHKDTWFIEVCKKPHLLVWARLKGYPPWPAKAMKCKDGMVDCRFFGAHDKAWVPLKDCFLYSKVTSQLVKVKKGSHLESGIQEVEKHIKKLEEKFGQFVYPAYRIPYRPFQELEQLRMMIPNYNPTGSSRCIHPDRIFKKFPPKALFNDDEEKLPKEEDDESLVNNEKRLSEEVDSEDATNFTEEIEKRSDSPPHNDAAAGDGSFDSCSEVETTSTAQADVTPPPSSAAKAETTPPSSTKPSSESSTPPRKLVSVKNIDSINASVTNTPVGSPTSIQSSEMISDRSKTVDESREASPSSLSAMAATAMTDVIASKSPSAGASANVTPSPTKLDYVATSEASLSNGEFDLNKVKDEPLEGREASANDIAADVAVAESLLVEQPESAAPVTAAAALIKKIKRQCELAEETPSAKKVKNDPKCRTVNITENVTLSLINQLPFHEVTKARPPVAVAKQEPPKTVLPAVPLVIPATEATAIVVNTSATSPTSRLVYGISPPTDINMMRAKVTAPASLPVSSSLITVSRPNTKVQPRIVNHVSQTNGMLCVSTKPLIATPSRSSPKTFESYSDFFNKVMNESLSEFQSQFRRIFESTLDKLVGNGDLKGRIVTLKKEVDFIKRNHELVIDELKRDYEVQIAELRATSVARTQFDMAAEKLKFEQEKERAIKEAKSKQWCSNCQKIANYYCCWNTAYCDFECQKEHWIQHMHVCKNDVKKKTTELSENEPPRIMMQSEICNSYTTHEYEKTGSTFPYGNVGAPVISSHSLTRSSKFNQPRTKVSILSRTSRSLLPRSAGRISSSPSSTSSSTNGTTVQNTYQNSRPSAYSIGNNSAAVYSPIYQK